jgi:hypothetical protein
VKHVGPSITRRRCLRTTVGAGIISIFAGCTSERNDDDRDDSSAQDTDATEDSTDEAGIREVLYDMTVEGRLREDHEFSSGDVLHVEASVNHEGRGVFTLNVRPSEELRKTYIEDAKSFSLEIEVDGTHIVNAIAGGGPDGRMDLLVELEKAEG